MAVKTILTEPNKLLRQISTSVKEVGKEERQLMDDMLDTMYAAKWYRSCSNSDRCSKENNRNGS